jgi:RNA polymerase sigma factor (sigma-70 family)
MSVAVHNDAELVHASLTGNRDAFGQIVARYQSLVCALAFSATGSLSQSEDLAQETFVAAWKQLADLREPEKLRSWLCRIARNLTYDALRQQGREPSHRAEALEKISETHSPEPLPTEQTISNEEQAILWRSLAKIPELYREPLVLFYREHQSVEAVAKNLELTEDAVKQRLSRGRKMLHEQVLAFVEGALEKTAPGKNFTLGVVAALPLLATTAKSATAGATAAKGGTALKMLFMTKTTQAIIVAAVTVTAVLTTQTVVHHYKAKAPQISANPEQAMASLFTSKTELSAADNANYQQQTGTTPAEMAQDFFDACSREDWNTVGKYWPQVLDERIKKYLGGMEVVSMGKPFKARISIAALLELQPSLRDQLRGMGNQKDFQGPQVYVPFEIRFKDGNVKKWQLSIRCDNPEHRWYFDGGL